MSPKTRNYLILGGALLGSILISLIAWLTLLGPRIGNTFASTVAYAPELAYDEAGGIADFEYAEEEYLFEEEPAEAPAADGYAGEAPAVVDAQAVATTDTNIPVQQRLIIRNGFISVSVENTVEAKEGIEALVQRFADEGAFIVNADQSGGFTDNPYISMTIRVPATEFDAVMEEIGDLAAEGTIPTQNESAEDVTDEYIDVAARLESLETARERLLTLMQDAATTEELLMAEQQLTFREQEIDALQGRLNYLTESARLSRIDISLEPYILSQPVDTRWRPAETVRESLEDLLDGLRDFGDFLIRFVIVIVPFLVILGLIIWGVIRLLMWLFGRRRRRRQAREEQDEH